MNWADTNVLVLGHHLTLSKTIIDWFQHHNIEAHRHMVTGHQAYQQ